MNRSKQVIFILLLILAMLASSIPVHNILHQHHFISADSHEANCTTEKHLQAHQKHCCQVASALNKDVAFISNVYGSIHTLTFSIYLIIDNDPVCQSLLTLNNKAPPVQIV